MRILACFPRTGKTTFVEENKDVLLDAGFSNYTAGTTEEAYLLELQAYHNDGKPIVIGNEPFVFEYLLTKGIPFGIVYPEVNCREDYRQRFINKLTATGDVDEEMASQSIPVHELDEGWEGWVERCVNQYNCLHIRMYPGEYLGNIVKYADGKFQTVDPVRLMRF